MRLPTGKWAISIAAALVSGTMLAATPAAAQYYHGHGWHHGGGPRYHHGWGHHRHGGWHHNHGWGHRRHGGWHHHYRY